MRNSIGHESLLAQFGTPVERVEKALEAFRLGNGVLVVDDEDRENEGDLIFAAETVSERQMATLIRECSGIVCLPMRGDLLDRLDLPPMVADNTSSMGTAFTVSIEAREGVTTGVSATDRVTTVRAAIAPQARAADLARPGHIFPLRASEGGVLARRGHTEASVDLATMAGFKPAAVLCEVTNPDGTMARLPEICAFGRANGYPVLSIEDLVAYRLQDSAEMKRAG
ncbi:3,4-dihydroxy-2-butanone-4-phosphate synthase [Minwuia sp.]|uniref:3,4-dihydroxy-2-butanone-4-phosphate synthase n=1 Tax=Minwuia sp. TaxID=2493630 RepID=UPI003A94A0B1